jgi:hypothetical protein
MNETANLIIHILYLVALVWIVLLLRNIYRCLK